MRTFLLGLTVVVSFGNPFLWAEDESSGDHKHLCEAAQLAVFSGDLDLLKALLHAKLEINGPIDAGNGDTLLHLAVWAGKPDLVRHLIQQGANPLLRNKDGEQPVHKLTWERDVQVAPLIQALERPLTGFDKATLAGVPVPVWREILGPAVAVPDPLEPLRQLEGEPKRMIPFIEFNGADPPKDLEPALSSRYPGWKPASAARAKPQASNETFVSSYWDKEGKQPGERVQITLTPMESTELSSSRTSSLISYVREHPFPAYWFQLRTTRGFLAGGGEKGYVVLIGGYWVKMATQAFEE